MNDLKIVTTPNNVLLIEDDAEDRLIIRLQLELMGLIVYDTPSAVEGKEIFSQHDFSLVLIHLGHAPLRALEICRWVRAASTVPILMLIGHEEVIDEEMALSAGSDDYVSKPIINKILTSRITQQLMRGESQRIPKANILTWGPLHMDLSHHTFLINGRSVSLTSTEFQFLQLLMENPHRVFSRTQILDAIGVLKGIGTDHIVDSHASRIRSKVRDHDGPKIIAVVRSVGFRLADPLPTEV
jgi:DNA-binding response OmpR family regulator